MAPSPRALFLLIACCGALLGRAQLLDSIAILTAQAPRFVLRLDGRGSFINNSNAGFLGVKVGLEHGRRFQYGLGYTFLRTRNERVQATVDGLRTTRLHMAYGTAYVDYAFYARGAWEARIPVQFGLGRARSMYHDATGTRQEHQRSRVFIYEPAMTVQYRFLRYFGVVAGWGFRLTVQERSLGERLTAPIYVVGLRLFAEDLYRDVRDRER